MIKHIFFINHINKNDKLKGVYTFCQINPGFYIENAAFNKVTKEIKSWYYDTITGYLYDTPNSFVYAILCSITGNNIYNQGRNNFHDNLEVIVTQNIATT